MSFDIRRSTLAQIERWIDATDPNEAKKKLLEEARKDQGNWQKEANSKKLIFYVFSLSSIGVGAATSILSFIPTIPDPTKAIITGILGAIITATTSVMAFLKYNKWSSYYVLAYTMKEETRDFELDQGDYADKPTQQEKNKLFGSRTKSLRDQYRTLVST